MADEISTTTSDQTTEATTATVDAAATGATEAAASTEAKTEDLGTTALGDAGEAAVETKEAGEGEGAKTEGVPEAYDLTPPEGFEKLDEATVAEATPVLKELGLSNEQANKLVPVVGNFAKKIIAERDQQFIGQIMEQRKSWLEEAKADKEIGGANWDVSLADAGRALDRLGFPKGSPLRVSLDESGYGNNPELVRLLARAGKAIGEDTDFVRGDISAAVKPKSPEENLYPNDLPNQGAK